MKDGVCMNDISLIDSNFAIKTSLDNTDIKFYNDLMKMAENDGTVDNTHPNDLGFASMAKVLGDALQKILFKN